MKIMNTIICRVLLLCIMYKYLLCDMQIVAVRFWLDVCSIHAEAWLGMQMCHLAPSYWQGELLGWLTRKDTKQHHRKAHVQLISMAVIMCGFWLVTHWGQDKMVAIFQTTFSNVFSWMKIYTFRLKFQWSLFLSVQLTIFQHWFR